MFFKALAASLLTLSPIAISGQTIQPFTLPSKLKAQIDRNYPGWQYLTPLKGCASDVKRSVLIGDFNGDGRKDYVIKIEFNSNGALVGFISTREGYHQSVIVRESARVVKDIGFTIGHKGTRVINGQSKSVFLKNDIVLAEPCAARGNANYWVYRNGGFETL